MQVCCKSAGSGRSAWLGQAHLYSRVCRSSFWETGGLLGLGNWRFHGNIWNAFRVSRNKRWNTQGLPLHIRVMRIVGNPWVAEWRIGQTGKSWRPRAFIFLHPLLPWLLCRCWPGPQADDPLCSSSPCYIIGKWILGPGWGRGCVTDNGKWSLLERGTVGSVHTQRQKKKISPTVEFARTIRKVEINRNDEYRTGVHSFCS